MEKADAKENLIRLIDQYQNLIFSICLKLTGDYFTAEDITQETFITAYQHWSDFDGRAEKAWLCRIASNKCIDYQREAARRVVDMPEEDIPERAAPEKDEPLRVVMNHEIMEELTRCLKALKSPYKDVAIQFFIEGKTAKEISEQSGTGIKTIQTQIYRARELLKKSYRKELLKE